MPDFHQARIPFRTHQDLRASAQTLLSKVETEQLTAESLRDFSGFFESVKSVRDQSSQALLRALGRNWQVDLQTPDALSAVGTVAKLWAASNNFAHALNLWEMKNYPELGNLMTSSHIALILACRDMVQTEPS